MTPRARAIGVSIGTALMIVGLAGVACFDLCNALSMAYSGAAVGAGLCLALCAALFPGYRS